MTNERIIGEVSCLTFAVGTQIPQFEPWMGAGIQESPTAS